MNMIIVRMVAIRDEHGDFEEWKIESTEELNNVGMLDELKCLAIGDLKKALQDFLDGKSLDIVLKDKRCIMAFSRYGYRGYDVNDLGF